MPFELADDDDNELANSNISVACIALIWQNFEKSWLKLLFSIKKIRIFKV